MTLEEFEAKEKQIFENMERDGREVREKGLVCGIPESGLRAYLVYLRYPMELMCVVRDFSEEVRKIIEGKAVAYDTGNLHQTIGDLIVGEREVFPDRGLFAKLGEAVFRVFRDNLHNPKTSFGRYVQGKDSIILKPDKNVGNYELISSVVEASRMVDINLRGAWGRHMTVSRFTEPLAPMVLTDFNTLIDESDSPSTFDGDGRVLPIHAESLNVGYFHLDRSKGFDLQPYCSFYFH